MFSMHTAHLANVSKSVTKNATFPRTGGLPCLITWQLQVWCISSSCGLMLMLKGSRVCKTQGRSYPPPPQMEYCVCVRVYEFLKSWNSNCRCKPALQLQAQASCIIRHTRSRSTDKVSHQRGPLCTLSCAMPAITAYRQTTTLKHFQNGPSSLA